VPFAVPLAVLVAFLDLIPLVGATIGSVFVALVTLFVDFPAATIVWLIVTVVYQQAEKSPSLGRRVLPPEADAEGPPRALINASPMVTRRLSGDRCVQWRSARRSNDGSAVRSARSVWSAG
jgi:hypothetical protein